MLKICHTKSQLKICTIFLENMVPYGRFVCKLLNCWFIYHVPFFDGKIQMKLASFYSLLVNFLNFFIFIHDEVIVIVQ